MGREPNDTRVRAEVTHHRGEILLALEQKASKFCRNFGLVRPGHPYQKMHKRTGGDSKESSWR